MIFNIEGGIMEKISIRKKIIFSIFTVLMILIISEGATRVYLCLKNKDSQYLKRISIGAPTNSKIAPAELKMTGRLVFYRSMNKDERYYKLEKGKYAFFRGKRTPFTINSLGFREKEFTPKKQKKIIRACVFGGSAVWGYGVEDYQTFPAYLSEGLGNKVEVINCGFPAYKTKEIYNLFKYEVINYSPDMIIIYAAWNDAFHPDLLTSTSIFFRLHKMLYYRWMLYTVSFEKYSVMKRKTAMPIIHLHKEIPQYYLNNLKSIIDLAKKKEIEVILVKQPINLSFWNDPSFFHEFGDINRDDNSFQLEQKYAQTSVEPKRELIRQYYYNLQMEELAARNNILLVNPISEIEGKKDLFIDPIHLSPNGTELLAKLVAKEILNNKLVSY